MLRKVDVLEPEWPRNFDELAPGRGRAGMAIRRHHNADSGGMGDRGETDARPVKRHCETCHGGWLQSARE